MMSDERPEAGKGSDRGEPAPADAPGPEPEWLPAMRRDYHAPPAEIPREEMWAVVEAGLRRGAGAAAEQDVVPISSRTTARGRSWWRSATWSAAAAAAVLAVGIGIGRWSAGGPAPGGVPTPVAEFDAGSSGSGAGLERVALRHLGRTESLLMTVRTDARAGRLDASVRPWARGLLAETRLLMDARAGGGDDVERLLADLELVLMEIVGAVEGDAGDPERGRTELDLAVRTLEATDLLPRIRSQLPVTLSGA